MWILKQSSKPPVTCRSHSGALGLWEAQLKCLCCTSLGCRVLGVGPPLVRLWDKLPCSQLQRELQLRGPFPNLRLQVIWKQSSIPLILLHFCSHEKLYSGWVGGRRGYGLVPPNEGTFYALWANGDASPTGCGGQVVPGKETHAVHGRLREREGISEARTLTWQTAESSSPLGTPECRPAAEAAAVGPASQRRAWSPQLPEPAATHTYLYPPACQCRAPQKTQVF